MWKFSAEKHYFTLNMINIYKKVNKYKFPFEEDIKKKICILLRNSSFTHFHISNEFNFNLVHIFIIR